MFVSVPPVTIVFPNFLSSSANTLQFSTTLCAYSLYSLVLQYLKAMDKEPMMLFCGAPKIPGYTPGFTLFVVLFLLYTK